MAVVFGVLFILAGVVGLFVNWLFGILALILGIIIAAASRRNVSVLRCPRCGALRR